MGSAPKGSLEAGDPTVQVAKAPLPISAGGVPNPDAFGLGVAGCAPYGELKHPVLVGGAYLASIHAFGKVHASPEVAVGALPRVEMPLLFIQLAPTLPGYAQHPADEGDVYVLFSDACELKADHQVVSSGEYVRVGDPGGRVGAPLLFLP